MILTHKKCFPSSMLLRNKIKERTGKKLLVTANSQRVKNKVHIRYGNSDSLNFGVEDTEYNNIDFIRLLSYKKSFSDQLRKNNLHSPEFFTGAKPEKGDFPLIIRTHLTKSGGEGMTVVKDMEEFDKIYKQGYWLTPYIYTNYELRVHILGGEIVKAFIKRYAGETPEEEYPLRNMNKGYHFSLIDLDKKIESGAYQKLTKTCNKVIEILEAQNKFFTLDVGWDAKKKEYFIFEGNSASGLNPNTADLYADWFISRDIL